MPYCPSCGTQNDEGSGFCKKCGSQLTRGPPVQNQPMPPAPSYQMPPYIPPRKKSHGGIVIAVILVVAIVVIAIVMLSVLNFDPDDYKATVYIHVTSTHISNVVDIDIYVDGDRVASDALPALSTITYSYDAGFSGGSDYITISGTGQGGGFGDTYDSVSITVEDGETYNVYLAL